MSQKEKLVRLYAEKSKHSNYQILSRRLRDVLGEAAIRTSTRHESERLDYMLEKLDFKDKRILDIGANTGYFSFELLDHGAKSAHYYEGNTQHAEFVRLAAASLGLENELEITAGYFDFDDPPQRHYDIVLLLNVLHHIGDDYGDKSASIEKARRSMITQLNSLDRAADTVVFQLGFNWQGKTNQPLFAHGTKQEMVDYVREGIKDHWTMVATGIAEKNDGDIVYKDLNDQNVQRDDSLGEFLNRPIFILRSKESPHDV